MKLFATGGQLYKFFGEQSEYHDGELIWPGYKGFPVLAKYFRPVENIYYLSWVHFFHSKLFHLENEEDKKHYEWVSERIVNGWFLPVTKEVSLDGEKVKIYLEWVQRYLITLDPYYVAQDQLLENQYASEYASRYFTTP